MDPHDRRLEDYLDKLAAQRAWDCDNADYHMRFLAREPGTNPRPDTATDEQRAFTMGRLPEFEAAKRQFEMDERETKIAEVAAVNPEAARVYRDSLEKMDLLFAERRETEDGHQLDRIMRRFEQQEGAREIQRMENVIGRLRRSLDRPERQAKERAEPHPLRGMGKLAERESALDEARRYTALRRPERSNDIG